MKYLGKYVCVDVKSRSDFFYQNAIVKIYDNSKEGAKEGYETIYEYVIGNQGFCTNYLRIKEYGLINLQEIRKQKLERLNGKD